MLHPPRFPVCYQGTGVSRGCSWAAPAPRGPENPPAPQVPSGQTSFQTHADTENCTEGTTRGLAGGFPVPMRPSHSLLLAVALGM